jgi:hypothetical protein
METIYPNKTALVVSSGKRRYTYLGAQSRKVNFVKVRFGGRSDFIAVRYSVSSSGLPSSSRFRFDGNVLKVSHNSVAFSPHANYTDRATAACRRS